VKQPYSDTNRENRVPDNTDVTNAGRFVRLSIFAVVPAVNAPLPEVKMVVRMLSDYAVLRDQARVCRCKGRAAVKLIASAPQSR